MPPEIIVDGRRYVPSKAAARTVDLVPDYISRLCRSGFVDGRLENGMWYVSEESLRKFLADQELQKERHNKEKAERLKQEQHAAGFHDAIKDAQHPAITIAAPHAELQAHHATKARASRVLATSVLSFFLLFSSALAFEIAAPPGSAHRAQLASAISRTQTAAAASSNIFGAIGNFFANLFHQPATPTLIATGGAQPSPQSPPLIVRAATTTIIEQHITQPVVERIVQQSGIGGVSEATLSTRLASLADTLRSEFSREIVASNQNLPSPVSPVLQQVAAGGTTVIYQSSPAAQRIDKLDNTTITNPAIAGGTITGATITGGSVTATDFSGVLAITKGGTGTSTPPSYGKLLLGNSGGTYDLVATSSLGIVSSGGTSNFGQAFEISAGYLAPTTTLTTLFPLGIIAAASSSIANLSTQNSTTTNATTTNLYVSGSATIGSGTGVLQSSSGVVSALANGSNGQVLKISGGVPTWGTDLTGSGGSSAWATTTDNLAVYPSTVTQVILVGASATTTTGNILEVSGNSLFRGTATAYKTITAPSFTATSTVASQLPYASSTAISSSYASSTSGFFGNLSIGNLTGFLKATAGAISAALVDLTSNVTGILPVANGGTGQSAITANAIILGSGTGALATTTAGTNGQVLALVGGIPSWVPTTTLSTIAGTLDLTKGGTGATTASTARTNLGLAIGSDVQAYSSTLDTFASNGSAFYLDARNLTSFGVPFYNFFSATTTDALAQGATNKYWSNTLFDARLSATTTLPNLTTLANLASVGALSSGSIAAGFGAINIGASALTAGAGTLSSISVSGTSQFANSANFFGLTSFGATATTTIATNGTITTPSIIATNASTSLFSSYGPSYWRNSHLDLQLEWRPLARGRAHLIRHPQRPPPSKRRHSLGNNISRRPLRRHRPNISHHRRPALWLRDKCVEQTRHRHWRHGARLSQRSADMGIDDNAREYCRNTRGRIRWHRPNDIHVRAAPLRSRNGSGAKRRYEHIHERHGNISNRQRLRRRQLSDHLLLRSCHDRTLNSLRIHHDGLGYDRLINQHRQL